MLRARVLKSNICIRMLCSVSLFTLQTLLLTTHPPSDFDGRHGDAVGCVRGGVRCLDRATVGALRSHGGRPRQDGHAVGRVYLLLFLV